MASSAAASVNGTQWRSLHKGLERLSEAYDELVARAEGWVQRAHEMEELAGDMQNRAEVAKSAEQRARAEVLRMHERLSSAGGGALLTGELTAGEEDKGGAVWGDDDGGGGGAVADHGAPISGPLVGLEKLQGRCSAPAEPIGAATAFGRDGALCVCLIVGRCMLLGL